MKRFVLIQSRSGLTDAMLAMLASILVLGVGCIRISSSPTVTPRPVPITADGKETPVPRATASEIPLTGSTTEVPGESPSPTPNLGASTIMPAPQSTGEPLLLGVRWAHEAQDQVGAITLASLDGGPLPDIVAVSGEDTVFTLGLGQEAYWRKRFSGPITALASADLDMDGVGDVLVADATGVTRLEDGEIRWRYAPSTTVTAFSPVDPARYLGASLMAVTEEGLLLALDNAGELMWSSTLHSEPGGTIELVPVRLGKNAAHSLVAGTTSGRVAAVDNGGRPMWHVDLGSFIHRMLAVDLDGDENVEIVAATDEGLYLIDHTGAVSSRWLVSDSIAQVAALKTDAGEPVELVVGSDYTPGVVSLLGNGGIRWQYTLGDHQISHIASADLDGDGISELLVGNLGGQLTVLDRSGEIRGQFNAGAPVNEIIATDMDRDGSRPELIVRAGPTLYLLDVAEAASTLEETSEEAEVATPAVVGEQPPGLAPVARPFYRMDVNLEPSTHSAAVSQSVTISNASLEPWNQLIFNVSSAYWPGIFTLLKTELTSPGVTLPEEAETSLSNTMLTAYLAQPLQPGGTITVHFEYLLALPRLDPVGWGPTGNTGWSSNLMQFGDWYPALVPYEAGSGWFTWQFVPVGDPVISRIADYDVTINVGPTVTVAAAGRLADTPVPNRFRVDEARAFAFIASSDYVRTDGSAGGIPIQLFLSGDNQQNASVVLQTAANALTLFSELYGPYPYKELVIAENGFLTSNEYSGFISLGGYLFDVYDGNDDSLLVAITAHEVAHQWWYGAVGNDQVNEPWLDEGLAMMSELLYYERYLPQLSDEWWNFRVNRWEPTGYAGATIYEFSDSASFVHNVYGQAAHYLQQLRLEMGEDLFLAFLQDYLQRYRGEMATGAEFFDLAQQHATGDLSGLRSLYFR